MTLVVEVGGLMVDQEAHSASLEGGREEVSFEEVQEAVQYEF
jgi:hypothetical protein